MTGAGFGAEEQATRRARKVARLRDEAARGDAVAAQSLRIAQRDQRNWSAGAEGERQVADALLVMERFGWVTLHDVHWPGRSLANIDHIAVGPGGVAVVDAKNWTGRVSADQGVLRQNGYRRTAESEGAAQAAAAVTALLAPQHRSAVRAVICLAGQEQEPTAVEAGVLVAGRWQLLEALLELPPRLSAYDVADIGRHLADQLTGPSRPGTQARRRPTPRSGRAARRAASRRPQRRKRSAGAALLQFGVTILGLLLAYSVFMNVISGLAK